MAALDWIVDERHQLRTGLQEPAHAFAVLRVLIREVSIEDGDRTQREQTDHRADLEPLGAALSGDFDQWPDGVEGIGHPREG